MNNGKQSESEDTEERESGNQTKDKVEKAVRDASSWIVLLGRLGYAAKGFVYVLVGILAAYSAYGAGAANDGTRDAMRHVEELPFGQFLLVALAFGLVFHAVWRFFQAFWDTEDKGAKIKGIAARAIFAVIGLIYIGLAFSAVKILLGVRNAGGDNAWSQSWTAWLLAQPFGQWLVGLAGIVMIAVGFVQFYRALTAGFRKNLLLGEMSEGEDKWMTRVGRFGFAARGLIFCVIGFFLVLAAYQANAGKTRGLGGALHAVEQQPFGAWLLALTAAGFVAYGLFMFVQSKYRRMVVE